MRTTTYLQLLVVGRKPFDLSYEKHQKIHQRRLREETERIKEKKEKIEEEKEKDGERED